MPPGATPSFEHIPRTPETSTETPETGANFESPAIASPEQPAEPAAAPSAVPAPAPVAPLVQKDPIVRSVETVLEEGLEDAYGRMNPQLRQKFRKEGERVAGRLAEMIRRAKVKAREALALITGWLKLIPGVNSFFLIQEAKIKTDKLVALAEEEKRNRGSL